MSNRIQYLCDDWTCKTCGGSRWKGVPITRADPVPASGETGEDEARIHRNLRDAQANCPPQYSMDWVNGIQPMLDYRLNQITALRAQLAETAVVQQQMGDRMKELLTLVEMQHEALSDLAAEVRGECPRLLDEDRGGNARLDLQIDEALAAYDRFKGGQ